MSGLLFLASVFGFAVVAYWAYLNDAPGPDAGLRGILGMTGSETAAQPLQRGWKALRPPPVTETSGGVEVPAPSRPPPRWRQFRN